MKIFEFNPGSTNLLLHLAHANGFPPQTYASCLSPLYPKYRIISIPARPLRGGTPPEWLQRWSQMADDLVEGLNSMGAQQVIGIGHSLGGVLTLYAAVRQPDLFSHLILIDPTLLTPRLLWQVKFLRFFGLEARSGLVQGALRRRREWGSAIEAYQYFRDHPFFKNWPDKIIKDYTESITSALSEGGVQLVYPPEWEARIYQTIPTDVWKFVRRLRQPTLVIRGENSNTFTLEGEKVFRKAKPDAVIQVVSGAGHLVPQEKPDEVGKLIQNFLRNVGK